MDRRFSQRFIGNYPLLKVFFNPNRTNKILLVAMTRFIIALLLCVLCLHADTTNAFCRIDTYDVTCTGVESASEFLDIHQRYVKKYAGLKVFSK